MKYLIIQPRQLGDVLLATTFLEAIKSGDSQAQIDWIAHPMAKPILLKQPLLRNSYFYPTKKGFLHFFSEFISWLKLYLRLRKNQYDVVLDLMNNPRTAIISFLTGSKKRISFKVNSVRDILFTNLEPRQTLDEGYLAHTKLHLLKHIPLPFPTRDLYPYYPTEQKEEKKIKDYLLKNALTPTSNSVHFSLENIHHQIRTSENEKPFLCIHPYHRHEVRRWPQRYFIDLAKKLIRDKHVAIIWLWGPAPEEKDYVLFCAETLGKELKMTESSSNLFSPLLSLGETVALCSKSLGWIGNSSGLSHIATASKTKTLEFHGPTVAKNWCHPNTDRHLALQRDTGCIQCGKNTCRLTRRECLEDISVSEAYKAASQLFF